MHEFKQEKGFTLVELSIVLVIIGLIVGGVLAGQALIQNARERAVISELQGYDVITNTFRDRFGALPGDLLAGRANVFFAAGSDGDQDGLLTSAGAADNNSVDGEIGEFWFQISSANLVPETYVADDEDVGQAGSAPTNKLNKGGIHAIGIGTNNYFVTGYTDSDSAVAFVDADFDGMLPAEGYTIDNKLDDGDPILGNTRVVEVAGGLVAFATGNADDACIVGGTDEYDVTGSTNNCAVSVRLSSG